MCVPRALFVLYFLRDFWSWDLTLTLGNVHQYEIHNGDQPEKKIKSLSGEMKEKLGL